MLLVLILIGALLFALACLSVAVKHWGFLPDDPPYPPKG